MTKTQKQAIEDLKAIGMTAAEAYDRVVLAAAPVEAASPVAEAAAPVAGSTGTPAWLLARGERKAARRALAAQPAVRAALAKATTPAAKAAVWAKAKRDAGITADEIAAHKAFVASRKAN